MNEIIERIVRTAELGLEAGWELIGWCAENGGDEFSFTMMSSGEATPAATQQIETLLEPFYRGTPKRERLTILAGQKKMQETSTWRLNRETIAILQREVPQGFFAAPAYSGAGWLEDFTIYRRGAIMLAVVSHEDSAIVRPTSKEHGATPGLKPVSDKKS